MVLTKHTTGYRIVKKVSRLQNKLGSTPVSGLRIETAGYGVSLGSLLLFRCNFHFLGNIISINFIVTSDKPRFDQKHLIFIQSSKNFTRKKWLKDEQTRVRSRTIERPQRRPSKLNSDSMMP